MRICEGSVDNLKLGTSFLLIHGNLSECNKKYNTKNYKWINLVCVTLLTRTMNTFSYMKARFFEVSKNSVEFEC